MAIHAIPNKPRPTEDEPSCEWCHKNYPCHDQGYNRMNCPRVDGLRFLSGEDAHYDKDSLLVWDVQAVSFRSPEVFEAYLDEVEGESE